MYYVLLQEEIANFRASGPPVESDYGEATAPQDAPEAISKAVASLPPEQMFELMKQMKVTRPTLHSGRY